jgi:hypothetical protein
MVCAAAARGALSVVSVVRGSGIVLRLPGVPGGAYLLTLLCRPV